MDTDRERLACLLRVAAELLERGQHREDFNCLASRLKAAAGIAERIAAETTAEHRLPRRAEAG